MKLRSVEELKNLKGKAVLARVDHNVEQDPHGRLKNDEKIKTTLPTLKSLLKGKPKLILMTHVGRPKGKVMPELSTCAIADHLRTLLPGVTIRYIAAITGKDAQQHAKSLEPGAILYLENVRFDPREEGSGKEQEAFGRELAALGEIYVNEAFASLHQYEEASTCATARLLPAYAGLQLQKEVAALGPVLEDPRRPLVFIVSGKKMKTKIPVIQTFLRTADHILLGGCIASTFIAARGFDVGASLFEAEHVEKAREIMLESEKEGVAKVHLPRDVVVATEESEDAEKLDLPVEDIEGDMKIQDVGKVTLKRYIEIVSQAGTIVWNGPLGRYEFNRFSHATKRMAEAMKTATAKGARTIVGGGDTLDFHRIYGKPLDAYSFVSTGGGAMLEFLESPDMPALKPLRV
jgi:phosphoglycerate kinase